MTDEQLRRLTELARIAAELARGVERTIRRDDPARTERQADHYALCSKYAVTKRPE